MADKEWEQQLDERIRWNSFLPLLGTKAFEKLVGKVGIKPDNGAKSQMKGGESDLPEPKKGDT